MTFYQALINKLINQGFLVHISMPFCTENFQVSFVGQTDAFEAETDIEVYVDPRIMKMVPFNRAQKVLQNQYPHGIAIHNLIHD